MYSIADARPYGKAVTMFDEFFSPSGSQHSTKTQLHTSCGLCEQRFGVGIVRRRYVDALLLQTQQVRERDVFRIQLEPPLVEIDGRVFNKVADVRSQNLQQRATIA